MCLIHPFIGILLLRLHLCATFKSNRTIISHGYTPVFYFKELWDTESVIMNAVCVLI